MDHSYQDRVSLELHRRIAEQLGTRPEWMVLARDNIRRWRIQNAHLPRFLRCYDEWEAILDRGVEHICRVLTDSSDEGQRLRQSSPFPGTLTAREVWEIKARMRDEAA